MFTKLLQVLFVPKRARTKMAARRQAPAPASVRRDAPPPLSQSAYETSAGGRDKLLSNSARTCTIPSTMPPSGKSKRTPKRPLAGFSTPRGNFLTSAESSAAAAKGDLARRVLAGERRALAQAITLVESARPDHRAAAEDLLARVLPYRGQAVRLGITGVPGVGKSTFIEAFGLYLIEEGHRVAVLAVDPTSRRSRGSILGDKTRMEVLSRAPAAFIRPSPAGLTLGGVARRTREAMLVCEAAGFDVVIVETVGVGQSETAVADMVDMFLLLLQPGAGDELQGFKRGIMELADLIVVNKADGELAAAAERAAAEYQGALQFLRPVSRSWRPEVLKCSSLSGQGIAEIWAAVGRFRAALDAGGELAEKRAGQALAWMWSEVGESLMAALRAHPGVAGKVKDLEAEVQAGALTPTAAADRLLRVFRGELAED
jgi:GTPase